jgi:hypothetical protein
MIIVRQWRCHWRIGMYPDIEEEYAYTDGVEGAGIQGVWLFVAGNLCFSVVSFALGFQVQGYCFVERCFGGWGGGGLSVLFRSLRERDSFWCAFVIHVDSGGDKWVVSLSLTRGFVKFLSNFFLVWVSRGEVWFYLCCFVAHTVKLEVNGILHEVESVGGFKYCDRNYTSKNFFEIEVLWNF